MNARAIRVAPIAVMIAATVAWPAEPENTGPGRREATDGLAVVELFTSHGCSSCPPADAVLAELIGEADKTGNKILCLSFHVDYWDRLGWKDPFSNKVSTARQRAYVRVFHLKGVYTPQMIVNGEVEFVGSLRAKAIHAVTSALAFKQRIGVKLSTTAAESAVTVRYRLTGRLPRQAWLNVAVVERSRVTEIKRGENAGRTLRNENVVRHFQAVRLARKRSGSLELPLPKGLNREDASVVVYVQSSQTAAILGADSVAIQARAARPASRPSVTP